LSSGPGWGTVTCSYEPGNELLDSENGEKFLNHLCYYKLHRKDPALWSLQFIYMNRMAVLRWRHLIHSTILKITVWLWNSFCPCFQLFI